MTPPSRKFIPDAILWHEGMLLRPEHFESMNTRQELLVQQVAGIGPFGWGVQSLNVDPVMLKQGLFSPLELELQMPSGMGICLKAQSESRPSQELTAPESGKARPLTVYAAVLKPVDDSGTMSDTRFEAVHRADEQLRVSATADADREEEEEQLLIPRLRPLVSILTGDAPSAEYDAMPIARMTYVNGIWDQDENYMAPALRVNDSSKLYKRCAETLADARKYASYLSERWRNMSGADRVNNRMELMNLRGLSASLPTCDALLESGEAHPFSLYLSFCALAGLVAGIAAEPEVPKFLPYNHNDLLESFAEVQAFIKKVLSDGVVSQYDGVPMTQDADGFSVHYKAEWVKRKTIVAVRPFPSREAGTLVWVRSALIGAKKLQLTMSGTRVLGARRTVVNSVKGLPVDSVVLLFELEEATDSDLRYLVPGEPLAVRPGFGARAEDTPQEMVLYVQKAAPADGGKVQRAP